MAQRGWDSFGAAQVLQWLFTGGLLDYGRLPVLTVLALSGAALYVWNRRKDLPVSPAHAFVLWGALFWTLVFFGRPFWGSLLTMLGVSDDMHLHRVIGGVQIFLVLLAAIALNALWDELARRWHYAAAAVATVLLLYPVVQERALNLSNDAAWGGNNLAAYAAERQSLETTLATVQQRGGRGYAGLPARWGGTFKVGYVPFYAFFSTSSLPAVSFLYHSMALTSDIMVRFNEWNAGHYRLFNVHTVVAPVGPNPMIPPFLAPIGQNGRFRIFAAPGDSYFDLVDVVASVKTTRNNFYDVNDRWLQSDWERRAHLLLDGWGDSSPPMARLAADDALSQVPVLPSAGEVRGERRDGEVYRASLEAVRACFALFKMTWHPNWKAWVDGQPRNTVMLSPGFVGVPLGPGHHSIVMRYQPEGWKAVLGFAGLLAVILLMATERRGWPARVESWEPGWTLPAVARRRLLIAGGLVVLALPVCIPLFTGTVLWGHDAFEYSPRLVELHQNITHGVLVPRWAPDLGCGAGQPLFLFHPPMIYYFGELWRLLGLDFVTAMNLACVVVVLLSSAAMFLLARLYFGDAGGWLGAAAYLYVPYFAVDLYVRSSMEEFSAFPFFALALFGFGAYARHRRLGYWLTGAAAYAGVLCCHFMAALLFTPLLLGFLALTAWMEKSGTVLWRQACGFLLGLGLSAVIWLPALASRQYTAIQRAIQGPFLYSNHFVYLHQLFYSPWGYGQSVPGPDDGMSFALGWSHLLLIVLVWIWIARYPTQVDRRLFRFFGNAAVLLCILMLQDALWIWQQVPLLQYVNLPWRLLGPVALCLAMLIAPLGQLLDSLPRWRNLGMAAAMALLIVPNLSHMHAGRVADVDLSFWTPGELALRGFETTTMSEVTPRWMPNVDAYTPAAARVISGNAEIGQLRRTPFYWSSPVNARVASTMEMQTAWFPGWEVRVDGQPVSAGPGTPSGLITFLVPAGEHFVEVEYGRTPTEKAAAGISIASLMVAIMLAIRAKAQRPAGEPAAQATTAQS